MEVSHRSFSRLQIWSAPPTAPPLPTSFAQLCICGACGRADKRTSGEYLPPCSSNVIYPQLCSQHHPTATVPVSPGDRWRNNEPALKRQDFQPSKVCLTTTSVGEKERWRFTARSWNNTQIFMFSLLARMNLPFVARLFFFQKNMSVMGFKLH